MKNTKGKKAGIDYLLLTQANLALTFIILKLTGIIGWSWIWVTCPLWIGLAGYITFAFASILLFIIVDGITTLADSFADKNA